MHMSGAPHVKTTLFYTQPWWGGRVKIHVHVLSEETVYLTDGRKFSLTRIYEKNTIGVHRDGI